MHTYEVGPLDRCNFGGMNKHWHHKFRRNTRKAWRRMGNACDDAARSVDTFNKVLSQIEANP